VQAERGKEGGKHLAKDREEWGTKRTTKEARVGFMFWSRGRGGDGLKNV
jgi:hypothetical protein